MMCEKGILSILGKKKDASGVQVDKMTTVQQHSLALKVDDTILKTERSPLKARIGRDVNRSYEQNAHDKRITIHLFLDAAIDQQTMTLLINYCLQFRS